MLEDKSSKTPLALQQIKEEIRSSEGPIWKAWDLDLGPVGVSLGGHVGCIGECGSH